MFSRLRRSRGTSYVPPQPTEGSATVLPEIEIKRGVRAWISNIAEKAMGWREWTLRRSKNNATSEEAAHRLTGAPER